MLRFGNRRAAPNYLSGWHQRRIFLLVMALGLVLIAMREAGKPQRWKWLEALGPAALPANDADALDTRLPAAESPAREPGTIRSPAPEPEDSSAEPTARRYFPGVEARLLARVQDDTIFRKQDYESWFNLLSVLRDNSTDALRSASQGDATYLQLYQQPAAYRGELVTIAGTVRRCSYRAAPQNDAGITGYYQLWIQAAGTSSSLYVAFVLELPDGFPQGDQLAAEVTLTGFFFKRWAYAAQDTIRTAPVLLARTCEWLQPAPAAAREPHSWWPYLAAMGIGVALAIIAFWYRAPTNAALGRYTADAGPIEVPPAIEPAASAPHDSPPFSAE